MLKMAMWRTQHRNYVQEDTVANEGGAHRKETDTNLAWGGHC